MLETLLHVHDPKNKAEILADIFDRLLQESDNNRRYFKRIYGSPLEFSKISPDTRLSNILQD